jgi:hypothetical protein
VTITITTNGITGKAFAVRAGGKVTFVNDDTQAHLMRSDPHPTHTQCPELNDSGQLAAGKSVTVTMADKPETCGFHDHGRPNDATLKGTIVVQSASAADVKSDAGSDEAGDAGDAAGEAGP